MSGTARDVGRLGVFGGSFDPVHRGHLHVARSAREHGRLDDLVLVPAAQPPHKPGIRLAGAAHRVAMLELAVRELGFGRVSTLELERAGPSYTIDTVRALVAQHGADPVEIVLVIGADNLAGLPDWREAAELLARVEPLVVARAGVERARIDALAGRLPADAVAKLERGFLAVETVDVAATDLRARLAAGERCDAELPRGVGEYVRAHRVYTAGAAP